MRNYHLVGYLANLANTARDEFAKNCGTTPGYLKQIAYGNRKCNASLAIQIDKYSGGKVSCDSLCPDVDFNYIRNQTHLIA